jgi:hypothetical protein
MLLIFRTIFTSGWAPRTTLQRAASFSQWSPPPRCRPSSRTGSSQHDKQEINSSPSQHDKQETDSSSSQHDKHEIDSSSSQHDTTEQVRHCDVTNKNLIRHCDMTNKNLIRHCDMTNKTWFVIVTWQTKLDSSSWHDKQKLESSSNKFVIVTWRHQTSSSLWRDTSLIHYKKN